MGGWATAMAALSAGCVKAAPARLRGHIPARFARHMSRIAPSKLPGV